MANWRCAKCKKPAIDQELVKDNISRYTIEMGHIWCVACTKLSLQDYENNRIVESSQIEFNVNLHGIDTKDCPKWNDSLCHEKTHDYERDCSTCSLECLSKVKNFDDDVINARCVD